jgi:hypothetical protein
LIEEKICQTDEPWKSKQDRINERLIKWRNKALHGQYIESIKENDQQATWNWLKIGQLKKETEGLITSAQDQSLPTNSHKARICKQDISPMCRMCGEREETINHIISECSKLAQTEYKGRHDKVAAAVHWGLCRMNDIECSKKWYEHRAEKVIENEHVKLLWDFSIQTDRVIEHRRPDIVLVDKKARKTWIIDIAVPADKRAKSKEQEKRERYQDLGREISKLWNTKVKVIPIVVGALGAIPHDLERSLKELENPIGLNLLQKVTLLGTARILRKVLEI